MFLSEKTAPGALKAAYKAGYHVYPDGEMLNICTGSWAVIAKTAEMPLAVTLALVEEIGHLPICPEGIKKGRENQQLMTGTEEFERGTIQRARKGELLPLRRLPTLNRERWQLYATPEGEIVGYDLETVGILQKDAEPSVCMEPENRYGMFLVGTEALIAAPARFGETDEEKLRVIGKLYQEPEPVAEIEPVNITIFETIREGDE
jgi:hypothetical protein